MSAVAVARHPVPASPLRTTSQFVAALVCAAALAPVGLRGIQSAGVSTSALAWLGGALLLVAAIAVLAWVYETFAALAGRTERSASVAVGAWVYPIANLWLPAVVLREAWRATVGRGGAVVWVWMLAWWVAMATLVLHALGLELVSAGGALTHAWLLDSRIAELPLSVATARVVFDGTMLGASLVTGGLLAHIVHSIGCATYRRGPVG